MVVYNSSFENDVASSTGGVYLVSGNLVFSGPVPFVTYFQRPCSKDTIDSKH